VTLRRLKQLFYWKGMKTQVRKFVQECDICQRAKPDRAKREIKIDLIWATEIVVSLLPSDLTAKPIREAKFISHQHCIFFRRKARTR
jgi:hypothetical protein